MYDNAASSDDFRPVLCGVLFNEDSCVATDTRVLVVYNQGVPKLAGKSIDKDGNKLSGGYPDYKRVIPQGDINPLEIDFAQLYRALSWWRNQPDRHDDDQVVFGEKALRIFYLRRLLAVYDAAGELASTKCWLGEESGPAKFFSPSLTGLVMGVVPFSEIDVERKPTEAVAVSYPNLILSYAIGSAKPKEQKPEALSWL